MSISTSYITVKSKNLTEATGVCSSLTAANLVLDEEEMNTKGRILFITPILYNLVVTLDTYKSKAMLEGFSKIVKVP